jgi:hypothetical protein
LYSAVDVKSYGIDQSEATFAVMMLTHMGWTLDQDDLKRRPHLALDQFSIRRKIYRHRLGLLRTKSRLLLNLAFRELVRSFYF